MKRSTKIGLAVTTGVLAVMGACTGGCLFVYHEGKRAVQAVWDRGSASLEKAAQAERENLNSQTHELKSLAFINDPNTIKAVFGPDGKLIKGFLYMGKGRVAIREATGIEIEECKDMGDCTNPKDRHDVKDSQGNSYSLPASQLSNNDPQIGNSPRGDDFSWNPDTTVMHSVIPFATKTGNVYAGAADKMATINNNGTYGIDTAELFRQLPKALEAVKRGGVGVVILPDRVGQERCHMDVRAYDVRGVLNGELWKGRPDINGEIAKTRQFIAGCPTR